MIRDFIPTIWSARILSALETTHVYAGVATNRNYQSAFANGGNEVKILETGNVTVSPYVENSTTVLYESPVGLESTFKLDNQNYFGIELEDISAAQSAGGNVINIYARLAALQIADVVDKYIAGLYGSAGVVVNDGGSPIEVNAINIVSIFTLMAKKLDLKNVPQSRYAIISPAIAEKIKLCSVATLTDNTGILTNGRIGNFLGFSIAVSNNVPEASEDTNQKILFGASGASAGITFAEQINSVEALRNPTAFRDRLRGLHTFGAKVIQPDCVGCAYLTVVSEPEPAE